MPPENLIILKVPLNMVRLYSFEKIEQFATNWSMIGNKYLDLIINQSRNRMMSAKT